MSQIEKNFSHDAKTLFDTRYRNECRRVNRFMIWLMVGQWIAGIMFAVFFSPLTWIGQNYAIHVHIWAAIFLGGAISGFAILWTRFYQDSAHSRHVMAITQMLWSALLIHLSGGRIETHFHVFASLAILSIYRDWKILVTATVVIAVDHFVRGVFYPLSAFGVATESPWRWTEHAAWVLFEVAFLIPACISLRNEIRELCVRQTEIEEAKRSVDVKVRQRTEALVTANERLAEKTREAEKLALVARYTDNAVVITDGQSRIEWVNEGYTRMTGYSLDDVAGKIPSRFQYGPKTDPDTLVTMQSAIEFQTGFDAEVISYRKDGEPFWVSMEVRPIVDERGLVSRFIAVQSDISERKSMEMSLAAAEQRLRSLVDNVPGSLYRCRVDGHRTMLFMSKSIHDITGYYPADFVESKSITLDGIIHFEHVVQVLDTIRDAVEQRDTYEIEYRIVDRNNQVKWIWERGQCLEGEGGELFIDGMIFDISDRKFSEAELASKGKLIEDSLNEIFIFDSESLRFRYVNRCGRRNTGFSLEELSQLTPPDIKPEFTMDSFREMIEPLLRGDKQQLVFRTIHERKDGSQYNVEVHLQKSRYQDQEVFLAMILDVTERTRAEAENDKLNHELVKASRKAGMTDVATGVLHNVGNVLNSVNVSTSVIRNRFNKSAIGSLQRITGLLSEHEERFVEFVRDDQRGQKLPAYIRKVTDALSSERSDLDQEFQDLRKNIEHIREIITVQQTMAKAAGVVQILSAGGMVRDLLTATSGSMANHGVEIVTNIDATIPEFHSDKHKILQILINLIGNAKDALLAAPGGNNTILLDVIRTRDQVVFRVSDQGIGISDDIMNRIFQHGFTTKEEGHGFGLHSSANAATELGGTLKATSKGEGEGAVFDLTLPLNTSFNKSETPVKTGV